MASYVGDVSSFYIDSQIQENFLNLAKEKESLYNLAYSFGYRPKVSYASTTDLDVYQLLPTILDGGNTNPDFSYSLLIAENTVINSNLNNQKFLTTSPIDFSDTSSADISFVDNNYFLIKKKVNVISAEVKTSTFSFTSPKKFDFITINDSNILQVLEVKDSDNNLWYEVPYLAQDLIPLPISNPTSGSDGINYLLNFQRVPRRFVTRVKPNDTLELQFGAGMSVNNTDTTILPTPENINYTLVAIGGVFQPRDAYSVTTNVITFDDPPPNGAIVEITTIAAGAAGGGGGGGASWTYSAISADTTAVAGYRYIVDTSSANLTITLPASGTLGDEVMIIDGTGNASTHAITVDKNGSKIQGANSNMTVTTDRAAFTLVYYNSTQGWILTNV
jgi:hypothetical protein